MSSGRSRGETWGAHPPLFFDQSEAQWAKKNFFETRLPRPLSQRLDDCPFPLSEELDPPLMSVQSGYLPAIGYT